MSLRSPIARARGLGSAKEGTGHWWHQRVSAVALLALVVWFVISLLMLTGADWATASDWLSNKFNAGLMLLLIVFLFYHLKLGLQVVIEDYVHGEAMKIASILLMSGACLAVGLACALAVLDVAFGG
jgi:succinate dehydrogenase / fumarate reductase membrane anchor subunit